MSTISVTQTSPGDQGPFEAVVGFEGAGQYPVTVADPFAGDAAGERLLAWYFEEHLRYPFLDMDLERAAVACIAQYGRDLFAQVFGTDTGCSYEYRRAQDAGFDDCRLEIVGSWAFHRLHWEALRDPKMQLPLGVRVPLVRRVGRVGTGFDVAKNPPTLNILVVTARPDGAGDVGYRTISRPLLAAIRQARLPVAVDLVRPGTWPALSRRLQEATGEHGSGWYHIVHFDVHGAVTSPQALQDARPGRYLFAEGDHDGDEAAFLFFETATQGKAKPVPTTDVAALLVEHRVPIAVMNACQSAMQGRGSEASLAQQLVEAGVPVAVGMAYSVTVSAAALMMPVLYERLAAGSDLIGASHVARRRLFDQATRRAYFDQDLDLDDWMLPVVFWQRPVSIQPRALSAQEEAAFYEHQAQVVDEPEPEYGFVGRDLDVQAVEHNVLAEASPNELLVKGMAGAGKSTLLRHLAWWWQLTGLVEAVFAYSYEDRAWTLGQILASIAAKLLDPESRARLETQAEEAQVERIVSLLRAHRHLLVLDNAESITATPAAIPHSLPDQEQARLRRFLARLKGGKTLVLIGSRSPEAWLAPGTFGPNVCELGGLDPQAASELVERILVRHGAVRPEAPTEREALTELVDLLGGFPLPLEVVLPALATSRPTQVLSELRSGGEGADPAGIIQRAVEFSHGRLDPATQNSLLVLAPFTSVIPTLALKGYAELLREEESVKALGALDLPAAIDQAISVGLADHHSQLKTHVQLQPILPWFLRARLANQPDLQPAVWHAHYRLYMDLASQLHRLLTSREAAQRSTGTAITRAEYANLTTALDHAVATAAPLAPLVAAIEEYLDQAKQQNARRQLLEHLIEALGQAEQGDRRVDLANLHNLAGHTALAQHRLEDAKAHHDAELSLRQRLGDRRAQGVAYHQLGTVAREQRRFEEAERHCRKALEIELEFNDRYRAARTYHQLGMVAEEQRRFEEAERHFRKALEIKLEFNDRHGAAATYHQLGRVAEEQRRFEDSEGHYRQALKIYIEFNDHYSAASTYHQLGNVAHRQRRFEESERHYRQALKIYIEFNDRSSAASTYHQLGRVAEEQRRFEEAEGHYHKALEIKLEFNDRHGAASTYHQLGMVAQEQQRLEEAEGHYHKALEIKLEFNDRHGAAGIYHQLGIVAHQQQRFEEAEGHYHKALEIKLEFSDRHGAASTYYQLGVVAQEQRRFEDSEGYYRQALEIYIEFNDRYETADIYDQLGVVAQEQRRLGEAERDYRKALEIYNEFNHQPGAARSSSRLGILLTGIERAAEAIPFSLDAVVIRKEAHGQWSGFDLAWLKRQRLLVGDKRFRQAVEAHPASPNSTELDALLDQVDEPPAD
jgi:tetratricopeptide (TPR) repeat protein